jgi:hypothetical protein
VERFLRRVESEYLPNPYHNAIHAADVTQTAAVILSYLRKQLTMTKLEMFSIIVAAAVHDLGHLGVNNDFLINSKHARATTYNDKSVNESYHCSRAFEVARTVPGCDLFATLTVEEQKQVRGGCMCMRRMGLRCPPSASSDHHARTATHATCMQRRGMDHRASSGRISCIAFAPPPPKRRAAS